jgi:nicotinamide/nicotinate riboside kinase
MVIGIGGCSRSGKSTLTNDLVWHFRNQNKRAIAIPQDDFVFKISDIPLIQDRTDWDTPASLNFELMAETILFFQQSFDVVILEGHFAFSNSKLNTLFDYRIFTEISEQIYLQRRAMETRWGQEPDWFISHVWNSFLTYGQPDFLDANLLVVSGERPFEIEKITHYLSEV